MEDEEPQSLEDWCNDNFVLFKNEESYYKGVIMNLKEVLSKEISLLEQDVDNLHESKESLSDIVPEVEIKYEQAIDSVESVIHFLKDLTESLEE